VVALVVVVMTGLVVTVVALVVVVMTGLVVTAVALVVVVMTGLVVTAEALVAVVAAMANDVLGLGDFVGMVVRRHQRRAPEAGEGWLAGVLRG